MSWVRALAVTKMRYGFGSRPRPRIRAQSSRPSMPGIVQSRIASEGASGCWNISHACSPPDAETTS